MRRGLRPASAGRPVRDRLQGMMLVGSAIASYGLATLDLESSAWVAVERPAVIAFLLALVLSFIIVLRLVWRWFRGAAADEDERGSARGGRPGRALADSPLRRCALIALERSGHSARRALPRSLGECYRLVT